VRASGGGQAPRGTPFAFGDAISRRSFLHRAGLVGAAAALAQVPALLDARGLLAAAAAQSPDLTEDTLNGLVAFVLPGSDPYSVAQGQSFNGPGGLAANTVPVLIKTLDNVVPAATFVGPNAAVPVSGGVATLLNSYAGRVNPAATNGGFPSNFSRLSFAEKAKVFELWEQEPSGDGTEMRFLAGILPGVVTLLALSEAGVFDPSTRQPSSRPVGWDISGYGGPAEGHAELKGYYRGLRSATDNA